MCALKEPTSGLDSSSALNLMETLVNVAREGNRTVVTSIHQPSSQLYHMFDGLLLMAKGKVSVAPSISHTVVLLHHTCYCIHSVIIYFPL